MNANHEQHHFSTNNRIALSYGVDDLGRSITLNPLLAYALCRAGHLDEARQLAHGATAASADEAHFWKWLDTTCPPS